MVLNADMLAYVRSVRAETEQLVRDLAVIPAPSNHEERRAEFCRKWFTDNGFKSVAVDGALNVLAPVNLTADNQLTVVMAHTDTVFPDMEPLPLTEHDGFLCAPGIADDTANLAVLMICARYFKDHCPDTKRGFLFAANSGEEGLGNLKGSRKIVDDYGPRIRDFVTLDETRLDRMITTAVGSHRYKVTVKTPGGHSFTDFGRVNAIQVLSSIIGKLYAVQVPREGDSITTYNVGVISGGASVNAIAQTAEMLCEYRSDHRKCLERMHRTFNGIIASSRLPKAKIIVETVGERPCSGVVDPARFAALKNRVRASVKEVVNLEVCELSGSTDCNIPLSVGIPAVCFGVCRGSGCHTREEKLEIASLADGCRVLLDFLYRQ